MLPRGVLFIFTGVLFIFTGGVRMEGEIQIQKHEFPENFAHKNIGILHISFPKIWVNRVLSRIFCLGGKSILKKIFEAPGRREKFFLGFLGGPGACSP